MVIRNALLDGAKDGILMYVAGKGSEYTFSEALQLPNIWSEAAGQIFFSLSVCMGIMTSYGSYNPRTQPVISNNLIIAFSNSGISIVAGFAVFSIIGYLDYIGSPVSSNTSSLGLAFIAYPTACIELLGSNFWVLLLALTLFTLGIDSAFSMIEAVSTVIYDTDRGKKFPRMFIALVLCIIACGISAIFVTNWGFIMFDVVDHYINAYLMLFLGIIQSMGVGWGHDVGETAKKYGEATFYVLTLGYWVPLVLFAVLGFFAWYEYNYVFFILFLVCFIISFVVSFIIAKVPFKEWFFDVALCGPVSLMEDMCAMGREGVERSKDQNLRDPDFVEKDLAAKRAAPHRFGEKFFIYWWTGSVKYFMPAALTWIFFLGMKADIDTPYGDYTEGWQALGAVFFLIGFLLFFIPVLLPQLGGYDKPQGEGAQATSKVTHNPE